MKRFIFLFALTIIFLSSCKKETEQTIYGSWNWKYTQDMFNTSSFINAQSIEYSKDGTYKWYNNGELEGTSTFTLSTITVQATGAKEQVVTYSIDSFPSQIIHFIGDSLLLEENNAYHIYTR